MATLTKTISFLLISILLLSPLSAQSCPMTPAPDQKEDVSANACCGCCANSSTPLPFDNAGKHQCPCQMSEKRADERSPAVFVSHYDIKSEIFLVSSEMEAFSENPPIQPTVSSPHNFFLSSRDRPLYLLHSAILI